MTGAWASSILLSSLLYMCIAVLQSMNFSGLLMSDDNMSLLNASKSISLIFRPVRLAFYCPLMCENAKVSLTK